MALPFTEIEIAAMEHFMGPVRDNISQSNPVLAKMKKNGKAVGGGKFIQVPLEFAQPTGNFEFLADHGTINRQTRRELTGARYDWKIANQSIAVSELDILKTSGAEGRIKLMKQKIKAATEAMADRFAYYMFQAAAATNGFYPFQILSHTGSLAEIDGSTETWWRGQRDTTTTDVTVLNFRKQIIKQTHAGSSPDMICTTDDVESALWAQIQAQQRFPKTDEDLANIGFDNWKLKGAVVVPNDYCTGDHAHFLNTKRLYLVSHKDRAWKLMPWREGDSQIVAYSDIRWVGNLVTSERRALGIMTALVP